MKYNKLLQLLNLSNERDIDDLLYEITDYNNSDEYLGDGICDLLIVMRKELRDIIDPTLKLLPSFNELLQILQNKINNK